MRPSSKADEDQASTSLRHAEVRGIQNAARHPIPKIIRGAAHSLKNALEVGSVVGAKQAGHILEYKDFGANG
jgi:hypothetical protein